MSAFKLFTVANYQGSWWYLITLLYFPTSVAPQFLLKLISFIYVLQVHDLNSCKSSKPLNPQKWFTCNFSLQYPYTIQQTGYENTQTNQEEVVILI